MDSASMKKGEANRINLFAQKKKLTHILTGKNMHFVKKNLRKTKKFVHYLFFPRDIFKSRVPFAVKFLMDSQVFK